MRIQPLSFNPISKLKSPINLKQVQINNLSNDVFFKSTQISTTKRSASTQKLCDKALKNAQETHRYAKRKYVYAKKVYADWVQKNRANEAILRDGSTLHAYPTGNIEIVSLELDDLTGTKTTIRYCNGKPLNYTESRKGIENNFVFSEKATTPSEAPVICKMNTKVTSGKNSRTSTTGQICHFSSVTQKLVSYRENEKSHITYDEHYNLQTINSTTRLAMYFDYEYGDDYRVEIIKQNKNHRGEMVVSKESV